MKLIITVLLLTGMVVFNPAANSLEKSLDLTLGLEHTDNSEKTKIGEISDTEQKIGVDFGLAHDGQLLDVDIDYRTVRNSYNNDTQEDNTEVDGALNVEYQPIEGSLFLRLDSITRNVVNDKTALDVADNRQNRTITTFAPEWLLRPTPADQLSLAVNYTDIRYEEADLNSDRSGATVKWLRQRSNVDNISAQISYFDVSTEVAELDYKYHQAFLSYAAILSRLDYSISLGYNETKRDAVDDVSGGFVDVELNYKNGPSTWSLALGRALTDSSQGDSNGGSSEFSNYQSTNSGFDIYETTTLQASWGSDSLCPSCTVKVSLSYQDEDYDALDNDSEEVSVNVSFGYELSRSTRLSLGASYSDMSFVGEANTRDDYNTAFVNFRLSRQLTRNFAMDLFARGEERDSESLSIQSGSYDELIGGISLKYTFF